MDFPETSDQNENLAPVPAEAAGVFPPPAVAAVPEPPSGQKTGGENPVFGMLDILLIVLCGLVSIVASFLMIFAWMGITGRSTSSAALAGNAPLLVGAQTLGYLWLVGFMVALVRLKHNSPFFAAISWNMPKPRTALYALLAGVALSMVSGIVSELLGRWAPKSVPMEAYFRTRSSVYAMVFFGIAVAPLVEELFFRGFLYPVLARSLGMIPSIILTAASFALLHEGQLAHAWVPLLALFIVGAALTVARAMTRSVATGLLIHIGYNTTLFGVMFAATDGFRHLDKL